VRRGALWSTSRQKVAPIVQQALQVVRNLQHRGACGSEANTGDGAGILMQVPHVFPRGGVPEVKWPAGPVNTASA